MFRDDLVERFMFMFFLWILFRSRRKNLPRRHVSSEFWFLSKSQEVILLVPKNSERTPCSLKAILIRYQGILQVLALKRRNMFFPFHCNKTSWKIRRTEKPYAMDRADRKVNKPGFWSGWSANQKIGRIKDWQSSTLHDRPSTLTLITGLCTTKYCGAVSRRRGLVPL